MHFDVICKHMSTLTLRNVPVDLHLWLKQQAGTHRRSLNQEVILQLDALRRLPAPGLDAQARLARIRSIAQGASGMLVLDHRPEADILGLGADGLPG